jgi:hypothetical protein
MYSTPSLWVAGLDLKLVTMVSTMVFRSICRVIRCRPQSDHGPWAYKEVLLLGADVIDGLNLGLIYAWRFQCLQGMQKSSKLLKSVCLWVRHGYLLLLVVFSSQSRVSMRRAE